MSAAKYTAMRARTKVLADSGGVTDAPIAEVVEARSARLKQTVTTTSDLPSPRIRLLPVGDAGRKGTQCSGGVAGSSGGCRNGGAGGGSVIPGDGAGGAGLSGGNYGSTLMRRSGNNVIMKRYPYSFEDFQRHHRDYTQIRKRVPDGDYCIETILPHLLHYMGEFYLNDDEARDKAAMFATIQMYLAQHVKDFDVGKLAVIGSEDGLISVWLLRAAHHFLTANPLRSDPSVSEVIALAEKYERESNASSQA